MKHEFELGQEVRIAHNYHDDKVAGNLAKVIGVTLKGNKYYSTEYVLAVQGRLDCRQRFVRAYIDGQYLTLSKRIKARCWKRPDGSLLWTTNKECEMEDQIYKEELERVRELDFERVV